MYLFMSMANNIYRIYRNLRIPHFNTYSYLTKIAILVFLRHSCAKGAKQTFELSIHMHIFQTHVLILLSASFNNSSQK